MWDEKDERIVDRRTGEPVLRPQYSLVPCEHHHELCPKGHWSDPKELSQKNALAYNHYQRCKATMSFPEDEIVRENAAVIHQMEKVLEMGAKRFPI